MPTITDIYTYDRAVPAGVHGIEVEVEAEGRLPRTIEGFTYHEDRSLRGESAEYVTPPVDKKKALSSLDDLFNTIKTSRPKQSLRTSVHVHSNVRDKTINSTLTTVALYWLLEDLLVKYCGKDRWENLFCLRANSSESQVYHLRDNVTAMRYSPFDDYDADRWKYCGINLCPVRSLGTLEFRTMEGCLDLTKLTPWIEQIDYMVNGHKFSSPEDVLDKFWSSKGGIKFAEDNIVDSKIISATDTNDISPILEQSAALIAPFAYAVDWQGYEKKMAKLYAVSKKSEAPALRPRMARALDPNTITSRTRVAPPFNRDNQEWQLLRRTAELTTALRWNTGGRYRCESVDGFYCLYYYAGELVDA